MRAAPGPCCTDRVAASADAATGGERHGEVLLRPVRPEDLPALEEVCLRTGDRGADASARTRFPALLGDVYATPYAVHEARFATVVEDGHGVGGYLLGCLDTAAFERWRERSWWPPLRERYPLPEQVADGFDTPLLRAVHSGVPEQPVWRTHPSHLHVDLLPRLQGRGLGGALVRRLWVQLTAAGSPGVHLGVAAANPGAVRFYRRTGFTELSRDEGGYVFGRSLPAPPGADAAVAPEVTGRSGPAAAG